MRGAVVRGVLLFAAVAGTLISCATPPRTPLASAPAPAGSATPARRPSFLDRDTIVSFYGRALGTAPFLGMLGVFRDFDDMDLRMQPYLREVDLNNGDKAVAPAIHLIYAMAIPCAEAGDCLSYAEEGEPGLVEEYAKATAARGWHLILDTQIGRSDPAAQVERMIDRGYLDHDNVHVALDPEFSSLPGQLVPGSPVGTLDAAAISRAQEMLNHHVAVRALAHRKLLIVHQFGDPSIADGIPFMIRNKQALRRLPDVDLVIDADGLGAPGPKVIRYNTITNSRLYPFIDGRGIKVYYAKPHPASRRDDPPMDFETLFGRRALAAGVRMNAPPDIVIIG